MPPTGRKRRGWTLTKHCGPFNDIEEKGDNEIDNCCRIHDIEYGTDIQTKESDQRLQNCLHKAGGHKIIQGLIKAKQYIDEKTGYASDALFRPGMSSKRKRSVAEFKRINEHYRNKKKTNEWDDCTDEDCLQADEHDPEEGTSGGGQDATDSGARTAAGGGGTNPTGGNSALSTEIIPRWTGGSRIVTRTFKRQYIHYVTNGVSALKYQVTGLVDLLDRTVVWNEGWAVIPWGKFRMAITAPDWFWNFLPAKRFRIKGASLKISDAVPLQDQLAAGTYQQTSTPYQLTPALHIYTDTEELLPILSTEPNLPNNLGTSPICPYSKSVLLPQDFVFCQTDPGQWKLKTHAEPAATEPERVLSLYNSASGIEELRTGQTWQKSWKNRDSNWQGVSIDNDYILPWCGGAMNRMSQVTGQAGAHYEGSIAQEGLLPLSNSFAGIAGSGLQSQGTLTNDPLLSGGSATILRMNNYADTFRPGPSEGPPYILIKAEPIYGSNDNPLPIYFKIRCEYSVTVELDYSTDCWAAGMIRQNVVDMIATNDAANFDTMVLAGAACAASTNQVHQKYGPHRGRAFYN